MNIQERLRLERQELMARLAEIDKVLGQYERIEQEAQRLLDKGSNGDSPSLTGGAVGPHTRATYDYNVGRLPVAKKTPMREFEDAVIEILAQAEAPMDRAELYDALIKNGIVIGDGDRDKELNALSARAYRMTKAGKLVSQRGRGYSLNVDVANDSVVDGEPSKTYDQQVQPVHSDDDDLSPEWI